MEHKMGEKWNWNLLRRNLSCSDWRYMWGSHELLAASCRDLVGYQVEYTAVCKLPKRTMVGKGKYPKNGSTFLVGELW